MREAVYVADANVLIDLLDLSLGDLWTRHFRCVPSLEVFDEVESEGTLAELAWLLDAERVERRALAGDQLARAESIRTEHPGLSLPDCTVVVLAREAALPVLSGDGPMRRKSGLLGIEVHGMLYVLQRLVEREALPPQHAIRACRAWQRGNPRTPTALCNTYCARWQTA